jgi:small GTP-binding protein
MNYDEKCQLLIIGDSTVGKTSILYRYSEDKFNAQHLATVGIDFYTKDEKILNKIVRVKIWDTAGQERYKSLTNAFFRNANGIILVYDINNLETFENLKYWIQSINQNLGEKNDIKKIIIGNKVDLQREVKKDDAEGFARGLGIPYFESSAKLNTGIYDSIQYLVNQIISEKISPDNRESNLRQTIKLKEYKSSKCGC